MNLRASFSTQAEPQTPTILRHKTALKRSELSAPAKAAILHGIITPQTTILDYGCGRGGDVIQLANMGYAVRGYDPYYFPNNPIGRADVVMLSYVLNTIEDRVERERTLIKAYKLARESLIVSGIISSKTNHKVYADGYLTKWNTFERHWLSPEFRHYIEDVIGVSAIRLSQGIYKVPQTSTQVLALESLTPKIMRKLLSLLVEQQRNLEAEWIPSDDTFLERHSVKGHAYWRLRSPGGTLPGKRRFLYLGREGSSTYNWGVEALERRWQLTLLKRRIAKIQVALS